MTYKRLFLQIFAVLQTFTAECAQNYFRFIILLNMLFVLNLFAMDTIDNVGFASSEGNALFNCNENNPLVKAHIKRLKRKEAIKKRLEERQRLEGKKIDPEWGEDFLGERFEKDVEVPEDSDEPVDMKTFYDDSCLTKRNGELGEKYREERKKRLFKLKGIFLEKKEVMSGVQKIKKGLGLENFVEKLSEVQLEENKLKLLYDNIFTRKRELEEEKRLRKLDELNKMQDDVEKNVTEVAKGDVDFSKINFCLFDSSFVAANNNFKL